MAAKYVVDTLAELEAISTANPAAIPVDAVGFVMTGDKRYEWDGDSWVLKSIGGAGLVADPSLTYVTYSDATYTYYCEAPVGTARSTAAWQVSRKTNATGDFVYAGTGAFDQPATSLAVVGGLTYTLGA
jgi:hypothetical protein